MEFLKNFFNDDNTKVGLCGFDMKRPNYGITFGKSDLSFRSFQSEKAFETDFGGNVLLF